MEAFTDIGLAFLFGGGICAVCQIFIDKTALTPARILSSLVVIGVLLGALGIFEPLSAWFGCGITVPLLGFGGGIAKGVREALAEEGFLGIFKGPLSAASAGTAAALLFGFAATLLFRPRPKKL